MYTAEEFRQDIIANIRGNSDFSPLVASILQNSKFQFNDTNYFTRVIWNTYERNLVIFCAPDDRIELENHKEALYSLCTKVHGNQDDYLIMSLEIIAKNDILPVSNITSITDSKITISTCIVIDRSTNNIGHGGFGSVYKYYDEEKEEMIAVKIYEPSIFQTSSPEIMKKRFLREGKKLISYSHPNVVKAFDYGFLGDNSAYIKMEYISGTRLSDFILSNKPLNPTLINNLCYQYIDAMAYVHSQTDMHRDISYSNVMITNNNKIKVLDFGFARNADDSNYDTEYKDIQRKFVLPNEKYTFRTEIYCMGAILYTLITGNTFDDYNETLIESADCNTKLKEATKICLSNDPNKRFENAIQLKNYVHENEVKFSAPTFSLDFFKDLLKDKIILHFNIQSLPTKEHIKKWLEHEYREIIESSTFQSTINLVTLLNRISGITKITYYKNINYDLEKASFVHLINFYDTLSTDMQDLFIRNIHLIILEVSKDDDLDLPFN